MRRAGGRGLLAVADTRFGQGLFDGGVYLRRLLCGWRPGPVLRGGPRVRR